MNIIILRNFKRDTGYSIDNANEKFTTYWHFFEEVKADEFYKNYCEWMEENLSLLTRESSEYIYSFMPDWIKEQPRNLDPTFYGTVSSGGDERVMLTIKSILNL